MSFGHLSSERFTIEPGGNVVVGPGSYVKTEVYQKFVARRQFSDDGKSVFGSTRWIGDPGPKILESEALDKEIRQRRKKKAEPKVEEPSIEELSFTLSRYLGPSKLRPLSSTLRARRERSREKDRTRIEARAKAASDARRAARARRPPPQPRPQRQTSSEKVAEEKGNRSTVPRDEKTAGGGDEVSSNNTRGDEVKAEEKDTVGTTDDMMAKQSMDHGTPDAPQPASPTAAEAKGQLDEELDAAYAGETGTASDEKVVPAASGAVESEPLFRDGSISPIKQENSERLVDDGPVDEVHDDGGYGGPEEEAHNDGAEEEVEGDYGQHGSTAHYGSDFEGGSGLASEAGSEPDEGGQGAGGAASGALGSNSTLGDTGGYSSGAGGYSSGFESTADEGEVGQQAGGHGEYDTDDEHFEED